MSDSTVEGDEQALAAADKIAAANQWQLDQINGDFSFAPEAETESPVEPLSESQKQQEQEDIAACYRVRKCKENHNTFLQLRRQAVKASRLKKAAKAAKHKEVQDAAEEAAHVEHACYLAVQDRELKRLAEESTESLRPVKHKASRVAARRAQELEDKAALKEEIEKEAAHLQEREMQIDATLEVQRAELQAVQAELIEQHPDPVQKNKMTNYFGMRQRIEQGSIKEGSQRQQAIEKRGQKLIDTDAGKRLAAALLSVQQSEKEKLKTSKLAAEHNKSAHLLAARVQKLSSGESSSSRAGRPATVKEGPAEAEGGASLEGEDKEKEAANAVKQLLRKRPHDGKPRLNHELAPTERKQITSVLDASLLSASEARKKELAFWNDIAEAAGCSVVQLKALNTPEGREMTKARTQKHLRAGKKRYQASFLKARASRGIRESTDREGGVLRPERLRVKNWCESEQQQGHDVSGWDLLDQLELECEQLVFDLQAAAKLAELSKADKERLLLAESLMEKGLVKSASRCNHKAAILKFCDQVERKPDLVFPMTAEESQLVCELSWQSFDRVMHILIYGTTSELSDFVGDPEGFRDRIENGDLPLVCSDAVPCYLDVATGKICIPASCLTAQAKRRLAKKWGIKPEAVPEQLHVIASGESRGEKDRITWLCRQVVYGVFRKLKPGEAAVPISGKMLKSIWIVHCSQPVVLDWICPETDTWLKSHTVKEGGRTFVRVAGEPVNPALMASWRQCRREHPYWFKDIIIVGQEKAYMNEVVCAFHAELNEEEVGPYSAHMVDMFSGELTETMEKINFGRSQVKLVIGPKQTAKLQLTDIRYAKIGKDAATKKKHRIRQSMRRKAYKTGVAPKLEAGTNEIMELANCMHGACVAEAKQGSVEKDIRRAGWVAYEAGPEKLRKIEQTGRWADLPLGGVNLPETWLANRFSGLDAEGVPVRPDWTRLHKLRMKQQADAHLKTACKREETSKAVIKVLKKTAAGSLKKKKEKYTAESGADLAALQQKYEEEDNEKDTSLGFLSEYLLQIADDEEQVMEQSKAKEEDKEEVLEITLREIGDLEDREDSVWLHLPPKRRREILMGAREQITSKQVKGNTSGITAEEQTVL